MNLQETSDFQCARTPWGCGKLHMGVVCSCNHMCLLFLSVPYHYLLSPLSPPSPLPLPSLSPPSSPSLSSLPSLSPPSSPLLSPPPLPFSLSSFFVLAKMFYSYAIFATYMVQFYVPMDFLEPVLYKYLRLHKLKDRFPTHHSTVKTAIENLFRAMVVMVTGMSVLLPMFN